MKLIKSLRSTFFIIAALLLSQQVLAEVLVIGQLSDRPKKDLKQLRPMVEAAASHLQSLGITSGKVELFKDQKSLIKGFKQGRVHWITETPFTAAMLVHEADAIPLLMKWKSRQQRYQTYIYTHKDSGIETLADLQGKRIAFEHNSSFSSYFLPRMSMEKKGFYFNQIDGVRSDLHPEQINFIFSRNEKNNALWVHKGLVEAGALNNGDWENSKRLPESLKPDFKIIYRSDNYPRALELISPQMRPEVRQGLKAFLLNLNPQHDRGLLERYEKTTGFEEPIEELPQLLEEIYTFSRAYRE